MNQRIVHATVRQWESAISERSGGNGMLNLISQTGSKLSIQTRIREAAKPTFDHKQSRGVAQW
jgi:hypothetical protein